MWKTISKRGFLLGMGIELDEFELKASGSIDDYAVEKAAYQQRLNSLIPLSDKELDELDKANDMKAIETELAKLINAWSDKAAEKQLIASVREMRKKS